MSEHPEHDKLMAVSELSQAIGEFIDWCESRRMFLCQVSHGDWHPVDTPITTLLAEHFDIDLMAIENEKRAMLDALREANKRA